MSDDLVKRLRSVLGYKDLGICPEAADRIEELEATNKRLRLEAAHANDVADAAIEGVRQLEAKLGKVVCFIKEIEAIPSWGDSLPIWRNAQMLKARTTLAELKGQDDGSA